MIEEIARQVIPPVLFWLMCSGLFKFGWTKFRNKKRCTEEITGECKKVTWFHKARSIYYSVEFCYMYEGKKIDTYALEEMSGKRAKKFEPGKVYPLYIDPKNPRHIRCTKKVYKFDDWFYILPFGFVFFAGIFIVIVKLLELIF